MKIAYLSPGTGSFYCGTCMRDNALVLELRELGHTARLIPLYLPLQLDETSAAASEKIEFGGISVYLQQHLMIFRHLPRFVDRLLNAGPMLRFAARRAGMTDASGLGAMTFSMLRGELGRQARELRNLADDLAVDPPDVIILSHALLLGMARELKSRFACPIVCNLQGEDGFIDDLNPPWNTRCWAEASERAREIDAFIAVSHSHGSLMADRLRLSPEQVEVIHNGIHLDGFDTIAPASKSGRTVGFLSRICPCKGAHVMVDAFIRLKQRAEFDDVQLCMVGSVTHADAPYLGQLRATLDDAGLGEVAHFHTNVTREAKIALLKSMDMLSVPPTCGESFGLYVLEAWAAGVPVVQPRSGAFPELLGSVEGGLLVEPGHSGALVDGWTRLLENPDQARKLGELGREAVRDKFTATRMAEQVETVLRSVMMEYRDEG